MAMYNPSATFTRRTALGLFAVGAAGAAGAAGVLAGCGGSGGSGRDENTVLFHTIWNPDLDDPRSVAQTRILDAFAQKYPDITVELQVVPWQDTHRDLLRATSANRGPDVSIQMDTNLATLIEQNVLLPLDEFTGDWSAERKRDYVFPFEDMVFDGEHYAFRQSLRPSNALFYRTDLYRDAGFPEPPATEAQWREVSAAVTTQNVAGISYPLAKVGELNRFMAAFVPMMWAYGGDLYDVSARRPTFHEEAGVRAMQWFQDAVHVHEIMPAAAATTDPETLDQQFTAGTVASLVGNTGNLGDYQVRGAESVGVAPFPDFTNEGRLPGAAYLAGGWTMVMPRGANKEAAWRLLEFYQDEEAELIKAQVGNEPPTRRSVLEHEFFSSPDAELMRGWLDWAAANSRPTPLQVPEYQEMIDAIGDAIQRIIVNRDNVRDALAEAAERYTSAIG
jgi:ABC-type glycerol-3-phosphate transport system substrate-binding protein